MLLRGMGMDLEEIRELEEEIRRLWGEIPRERREAIKVARAENFRRTVINVRGCE